MVLGARAVVTQWKAMGAMESMKSIISPTVDELLLETLEICF